MVYGGSSYGATEYGGYGVSTTRYSRGDYAALPSDDTDLENLFTPTEYSGVAVEDNVFVDQSATEEFSIFEFKKKGVSSSDSFTASCILKSNYSCATYTSYLQVFNRSSSLWETIDSDNSTASNTKFTLTGGKSTGLSDYYDGNNWLSFRVYQGVI